MIPGAVLHGGGQPMVLPEDGRDAAFDAPETFKACVRLVAQAASPAQLAFHSKGLAECSPASCFGEQITPTG
jgi:hypothetical protein